MKYDAFKFLYPPRAQRAVPSVDLPKYDTGEYLCQPKYNGAACGVFTNGKELQIFNRHKKHFAKPPSSDIEFKKLAHTKKWFVYWGEFLNKSQIGEHGTKEKDKFVIWDVIVWDGEFLDGSTFEERLHLLENIYPSTRVMVKKDGMEMYEHLCITEFNGIYRAPSYENNFLPLYMEITKTSLYEGITLKKRQGKLGFCLNEINNGDWQLKSRRATKNLDF